MGTNFYRIPKSKEMMERHQKLVDRVSRLDFWAPDKVERGFNDIENPNDTWSKMSPWDEFLEGTSIHLGKRSSGWKFCWNFHKNKYYSNKEELLEFIRSGRVVDEYGTQIEVEEFIEMALEWGQPDGWIHDANYEEVQRKSGGHIWGPKYYDLIVDGLRVSNSTEFS